MNTYILFQKKKNKVWKNSKNTIETKYKNNQEINDLEILCLSCYAPLNSFSWVNKIANKKTYLKYLIYKLKISKLKKFK